jgi:hypothetical protein
MSSIQFNACLDMSHHGQPHPFKDAEIVADSLTGNHTVKVKCLFVVNRSCNHKAFKFPPPPHVKIQRIQIWWIWMPCSGSSSTYSSVMTGVIENVLHSTAKPCQMYHNLSAVTHKFNVSGHMFIWTFFLVLVCGTCAQSLSAPFSYTLYMFIFWKSN